MCMLICPMRSVIACAHHGGVNDESTALLVGLIKHCAKQLQEGRVDFGSQFEGSVHPSGEGMGGRNVTNWSH